MKNFGFGFMRLPFRGEAVDMETVKNMVDAFLANGFTYFDTAYKYCGGLSEPALREALVDRYPRESYVLTTKLSNEFMRRKEEQEEVFDDQLNRLGCGYFDYYLLHNQGAVNYRVSEELDSFAFVQKKKAEGKIRHIGISFHDKADVLDDLLTRNPDMEFVQLQINYADWESASIQSRACYEVARKHGKPVIIMEPVKGGSLAALPADIAKIFTDADPKASLSSWAIRFAASLDGLVTVLSGMSTLAQMEDNLSFMENFQPLTGAERAVVDKVRAALDKVPQIPCTACSYCTKGCPQSINIPGVFKAMNNQLIYGNRAGAVGNYSFATRTGGKASDCIACGQCEAACPQHIEIIEELKKAVEMFEG